MKTFYVALAVLFSGALHAQPVVINEIYGAGGNAGAAYKNDFVELFNAGSSPVSLSGWSIQYAASTSTGSWQVTPLSGTIFPGRYFLIQLAAGAGNGQNLPTPDVTGTIAMAATAGKVALVNNITALSGACPAGLQIMDRVGYGAGANCFEGSGPTAAPSATLSVRRKTDGLDTDNNASDFQTAPAGPQNGQPIAQAITFNSLPDHTYGDSPFDAVASSSSGLAVLFSSDNAAVASVTGQTITIHAAGQATITARQSGNGMFMPATDVTRTLNVIKAPLTIKANDAARLVGQANPQFNLSYNGFIGNDLEAMLDSKPILSCTANLQSPAGTYPILLSGGSDDNYNFTLVPGNLVVSNPSLLPNVFVATPADGAAGVPISFLMSASAAPNAATYTIQLSSTPDFAQPIEKTGGRSQFITGLSYNTTYFVRVMTDVSPLFGKTTRFTTGTSSQSTYLISPGPLSAGVPRSPRLICNEVAGAAQYTFEVNTAADFSGQARVQTGAASQTFANLAVSTNYFVRIRTNLALEWGPVRTFRTGSPEELSFALAPNDKAVNVSWTPIITVNDIGASSYTVQLSAASDFANVIEMSGTTTRFQVASPLAYATKYFVRVQNSMGGSWGPVRSFTTGSPAGFAFVESPRDGEMNVNYEKTIGLSQVPGATAYTISLSTDPAFATEIQKTTSGRTVAVTLQASTLYFCRVKTDLTPAWGRVSRFTTGDDLSLTFITNPVADAMGVEVELTVTAQHIPGAALYTIELNTDAAFAGTSVVKTSKFRNIKFHLAPNQTYYARVKTDRVPDQWGGVRHFTTGDGAKSSPASRRLPAGAAAEPVTDPTDESANSPGICVYPNPFYFNFTLKVVLPVNELSLLRITDNSGRQIFAEEVDNQTILALGDEWPAGVYLIQVLPAKGMKAVRIVKRE